MGRQGGGGAADAVEVEGDAFLGALGADPGINLLGPFRAAELGFQIGFPVGAVARHVRIELERPPANLEGNIRALGQRLFQRSEEHTSDLQSLMRISYAVFCLKKKNKKTTL